MAMPEATGPAAPSTASPKTVAGKSALAFRTIAEVARDLDLPTHVLRFWETKFPQIRPVKRRGGRRYYRPEDVALIKRIRVLLHNEGYTIRGVQKLLREGGGAVDEPLAPAPPLAETRPTIEHGRAEASTAFEETETRDWRRQLAAIIDDLQRLRDRLAREEGS